MSLEPKKEPFHLSVDMDDRAFLVPETRNIVQLRFQAEPNCEISIELVYAHNFSRLPPYKITLLYADAKELCARLTDAVYRAQTQNFISESAHITITLVANGYILMIEESATRRQLYLSTSVIWRVCNALYRLVDIQSPISSH